MIIELRDVTIRAKTKDERNRTVYEHILTDVCGEIRAGFTAVVGPSGCGKTTLLKTILGKIPSKYVTTGEIVYCGEKRVLENWTKITTYLDQSDALSGNITTRECLYYAAAFNSKRSESEINDNIDMLAERLYLTKILEHQMNKLSGGEVKRLKVAVELVINAPIILMDEPTTGLDSVLAYRVVQFLKEMAEHDTIIVCSIHQPDDRTLLLFEQVMLMNAGRIVYSGDVREMTRVIAENGFINNNCLEISTYVLDFLNTGRIKYIDPDRHARIVEEMVSKHVQAHRRYKRKYVARKSNEFYISIAPNIHHIITICERELRITFKSAHKQTFQLIFLNLLFMFIPFTLRELLPLKINQEINKTERQIEKEEDLIVVFIQLPICLILTNILICTHGYRHKNDFFAHKEISTHIYSTSSYYIGTMFLSMMYFLPMFILVLGLIRVQLADLFDITSLALIGAFFFASIFFFNFLLDVSKNKVVQHILSTAGLVLNTYSWIVSLTRMNAGQGWFVTIFSVFLQFSPASAILPTIILRVYGNRIAKMKQDEDYTSIRTQVCTRMVHSIQRGIILFLQQYHLSYLMITFLIIFYAAFSYFVTIRPYLYECRVNLSKKIVEEDENEKVSVCVIRNE
ncbi:ATP-binding Cassette (ABC) Superfamily [Trachipleistophora hominis]|uniref:ATP-binding Cassette (ABC) Superfamily n=1 Tax=Trachipleistophora hominis TaxID=72359 RepID=L7JV43_TRAHO|nr:ATP-binding Cassette (ABC) Superfamily [Trachipleistophora hominis]